MGKRGSIVSVSPPPSTFKSLQPQSRSRHFFDGNHFGYRYNSRQPQGPPQLSCRFQATSRHRDLGTWYLGVQVAQQNGINANMLFKWRRELRAGLFEPVAPALLPVHIQPATTRSPSLHMAEPSGMIEIIIGDAVVRLHAGIDAALLQLVLQSLRP